jgi:diguanylate cyclase (GGDEF)-like protein/PAS domain S-box-containing protein
MGDGALDGGDPVDPGDRGDPGDRAHPVHPSAPGDPGLSDALLQAMSEALYVVDRGRRITFWNPAAERLTGFSADEVIGRRCRDGILNHVDEEGQPLCHAHCPLLGTMLTGERHEAHLFLHHRDGHRVPVEISAAALTGPDGTIRGAVEVFHDDSRWRDTAAQLDAAQAASLTDPLTGLGNRRMLDAALQRHQSDRSRYGHPFAVLFADVDLFKGVNDRHGHDVGDQILQLVAATLHDCVRPGDTVGRWGGEEFLVIAPVATRAEAGALADRIRNLTAASWLQTGEGTLAVTLSVGAVLATDGETGSDVVARADAALLRAKAAGRNRTFVA